jgi:outer membrane protein assembly factor BamD (BamD/ComL family)
MARIRTLSLVLAIGLLPIAAQTIVQRSGKSVPQASTREELNAFGLVLEAGSPEAMLEAASRYREQFPKSEFFEYACVAEMQAAMDLKKYSIAEQAANTVLKINPANPEALVTFAEVLVARNPDSARQYAQSALDRLKALPAPAFSDPATWLNTKRAMEVRARRVLAQVSPKAPAQ